MQIEGGRQQQQLADRWRWKERKRREEDRVWVFKVVFLTKTFPRPWNRVFNSKRCGPDEGAEQKDVQPGNKTKLRMKVWNFQPLCPQVHQARSLHCHPHPSSHAQTRPFHEGRSTLQSMNIPFEGCISRYYMRTIKTWGAYVRVDHSTCTARAQQLSWPAIRRPGVLPRCTSEWVRQATVLTKHGCPSVKESVVSAEFMLSIIVRIPNRFGLYKLNPGSPHVYLIRLWKAL